MKVKDLIKYLKEYNGETEVALFDGRMWDFDENSFFTLEEEDDGFEEGTLVLSTD